MNRKFRSLARMSQCACDASVLTCFVQLVLVRNRSIFLSTVPSSVADGVELSLLYLKRWRIEKAFHELTTTLSCEIKTLAYPKAALFCFTLALVAYNVVSLIKTAMRSVHGRQRVENDISAYYLTLEIRQCWQGMQIAVPEKSWKVFAKMSSEEFADCLREIAKQIRLSRYRKHRRGRKKSTKKT